MVTELTCRRRPPHAHSHAHVFVYPNSCCYGYRAKHDIDTHLSEAYTMDAFCAQLDKKHMILAPFCGEIPCEDEIKKISAR